MREDHERWDETRDPGAVPLVDHVIHTSSLWQFSSLSHFLRVPSSRDMWPMTWQWSEQQTTWQRLWDVGYCKLVACIHTLPITVSLPCNACRYVIIQLSFFPPCMSRALHATPYLVRRRQIIKTRIGVQEQILFSSFCQLPALEDQELQPDPKAKPHSHKILTKLQWINCSTFSPKTYTLNPPSHLSTRKTSSMTQWVQWRTTTSWWWLQIQTTIW